MASKTASRRSTSKPRKAARASGGRGEEESKPTRDIWKGTITFGLVEIPVALVSAEKPGGLTLSYLDKRDFSPVGYRRYNKSDDREVAWSDIVHGYQYAKGEYVVLGKSDLARANPTLTQTISIERFVDAGEIEPIYFEKPYYLEPLKSNSKSYALLRETLRRTEKVGVARFAIRTKEHVGVVGVRDQALVLYLLRYASEVRSPAALEHIEGKGPAVSPKEIEMAERLVQDMTGAWDPESYKDEYVDDVMKVIEQKIESGEVHALDDSTEPAPARARGEIIDLMPLLRKSVEAAAASKGRAHGGPRKKGPTRMPPRRRSA